MVMPLSLTLLMLGAAPPPDTVPLYDDLGDHHHRITAAPLAQRYFDQGLRLTYAFNHAEAIRSFREAQRLDPRCAMCFWGEALAFGPNINAAMDSASGIAAWTAARRAKELARNASAKERAYIDAMAARYGSDPTTNRKALDSAYSRAMREIARRHPADDDAAVLYAESQMLLGPWDYWTESKQVKPHGAAALEALEPVIERNPRHAGACHYYIHAVEAAWPERAIPCAERLPSLMPGAGHVVHMPAHIYIRVGRYADAIDRNVHALHADEEHLQDMAPDGAYRLAYHPHNAHFLAFAAAMIGRGAETMRAAQATHDKVNTGLMRAPGLGALQHYYMMPLFAHVRFGHWEQVLAAPAPPSDLAYPAALRRYARALAYARTDRVADAERELQALEMAMMDPALEGVTVWDLNPVATLLAIGHAVASGEIAAAQRRYDEAIAHFRRGIDLEDGLTYDEPPPWFVPVRQHLGAVLLAAGRPAEAEAAFRQDLERHPENGWSLFGLAESLAAQGKQTEEAQVRERFARSWDTADVTLTAARF